MELFYHIKPLEYYRRRAIWSHIISPLRDILRKTGRHVSRKNRKSIVCCFVVFLRKSFNDSCRFQVMRQSYDLCQPISKLVSQLYSGLAFHTLPHFTLSLRFESLLVWLLTKTHNNEPRWYEWTDSDVKSKKYEQPCADSIIESRECKVEPNDVKKLTDWVQEQGITIGREKSIGIAQKLVKKARNGHVTVFKVNEATGYVAYCYRLN